MGVGGWGSSSPFALLPCVGTSSGSLRVPQVWESDLTDLLSW